MGIYIWREGEEKKLYKHTEKNKRNIYIYIYMQ